MKGHDYLTKKILFIVLFLIQTLGCTENKAISYERPLFTIKNTLKDEYLGLYFLDKKMGYFHGMATEVELNSAIKGYYLSGDAVIKVTLEGDNIYTILKEEILLDQDFNTLFFNYYQKIGDSILNILGRKGDKNFFLKTQSGPKVEETKLDEKFLPLAAAGFIVWKGGISEGKHYTFSVYIEALQRFETLKVTVGKKTVDRGNVIFPLHQKLGNIEITSFVLENGDTYKEESIQGFTLKRLSKDEALKFDERGPSLYDLFSYSLIPVDKDLSGDLEEVVLLLSNFDKNAKLLSSEYQKVEKVEGGVKITITSKPQFKAPMPSDIEKYLKSTTKIQSNDTQIKHLAKEITKDAKSDWEKVKLITLWVNKNIEKRLKDKSSALEVLVSREGECEAHSMLTAALLRSLGFPTKIVGGIVYSKDYKGFLYHAWNEVFLEGHFVPIDATFGEIPVRPYHLKLTEEENMEDVVLFIGKLRIKVLEAKKRTKL